MLLKQVSMGISLTFQPIIGTDQPTDVYFDKQFVFG